MEFFTIGVGKIALIVGLILLNAFFVVAEFALVRVRPSTLKHLAQRGSKRALLAEHVLEHLDRYLSACQVGVTLASVLIGWLGEPTVREIAVGPLFRLIGFQNQTVAHIVSFLVGTGLVAGVLIVLGEQTPKYLALRRTEAAALFIVYPLHWFYVVTKPAIQLLDVSSNFFCDLLGVPRVAAQDEVLSEEELRLILASSVRRGMLAPDKLDLLENIMEMSTRPVRQVMVPRTEIAFFNLQRPLAYNLMVAERTAYSRYPLVDGDLDHVVGIVHMKDLFWRLKDLEAIAAGNGEPEYRNPMLMGGDLETNPPASGADFLRNIARKTFFVPETMRLDALLREFQHERLHMAMVIDEYGGISGLVTLENVIEAIVGQIQDEFDAEQPRIQKIGEREFSVDGVTSLADVNHALGTQFSDEEVDTIGGLILKQFGRLPAANESVVIDGVELTVVAMDKQRIARVRVRLPEPPPEEGEEQATGSAEEQAPEED
jgi:CBS domain containing-hemolysin-like protein